MKLLVNLNFAKKNRSVCKLTRKYMVLKDMDILKTLYPIARLLVCHDTSSMNTSSLALTQTMDRK